MINSIVSYHKCRFTDEFPNGTKLHDLLVNFITSNIDKEKDIFSKDLLSILGFLNVS